MVDNKSPKSMNFHSILFFFVYSLFYFIERKRLHMKYRSDYNKYKVQTVQRYSVYMH